MPLRRQDFHFAQILPKFAQILGKYQNMLVNKYFWVITKCFG